MGHSRTSHRDWTTHVGVVAVLAMIVAILLAAWPRTGNSAALRQEVVAGAAVSPVLSYQGRMVNPATGAPLSGTFSFSLRLYNVASGGTALWIENKDIAVSSGLFTTLLGDTTTFPSTIFNGQNLWLGIKVGSDAEATPRQRLAPVAYAMYSDNTDRLDGLDSTYLRNATNLNAGTVDDARLAAAVTRDSEVLPLVKAADGSGSGVDADVLDGYDSSNFFRGTKVTQLANQTLNAGASVVWSSWGFAPNQMVMWWAVPTTQGGRLTTSVETLLEGCCGAGQGLITYFITVRNTGTIATNYDLIRYGFSQ